MLVNRWQVIIAAERVEQSVLKLLSSFVVLLRGSWELALQHVRVEGEQSEEPRFVA